MTTVLWEQIDENTHRMKVPHGWLVRCDGHVFDGAYNGETVWSATQGQPVFVPDMLHEWLKGD